MKWAEGRHRVLWSETRRVTIDTAFAEFLSNALAIQFPFINAPEETIVGFRVLETDELALTSTILYATRETNGSFKLELVQAGEPDQKDWSELHERVRSTLELYSHKPTTRVGIVYKNEAVLGALESLVHGQPGELKVVIAVTGWRELVNHAEFPVDVALLDMSVADGESVDMKVSALTRAGVRVIVTGPDTDPKVVREAIAAGALGHIALDDVRSIGRVIHEAIRGETRFLEELTVALSDADGLPNLSPKEREVLIMYGTGWTTKAIADAAGLSAQTVDEYLRRIRQKYAAASDARSTHKRDIYSDLFNSEFRL